VVVPDDRNGAVVPSSAGLPMAGSLVKAKEPVLSVVVVAAKVEGTKDPI